MERVDLLTAQQGKCQPPVSLDAVARLGVLPRTIDEDHRQEDCDPVLEVQQPDAGALYQVESIEERLGQWLVVLGKEQKTDSVEPEIPRHLQLLTEFGPCAKFSGTRFVTSAEGQRGR